MATAEARLNEIWEDEPGLRGWLATVDHKKIGKRYVVTAFAFLIVGGLEAAAIRLQLARADQRLFSPEAYSQLFTMHGVTMIFWYASPVLSGFANYLIPLMLGARDLAFPRLNAFTYWSFLLSGLFLYGSVPLAQAPHGGWFAYVPLTSDRFSPGLGMDFYSLALIFLTVSTTAGAINFLVTIFRLRAPGMTLNRMPLFMYSTGTTSFSVVFSLPALTVACVFLELQRQWGFHFFDPERGGDPILWQQLFWFFGHPWVYIVFLPATGMISMILPVFARRPIVGYPYVATATVLTGVIGFGVWVHHMFAVGMTHMSMSFFSAASMTISLLSAVQIFAWIATLWTGRPVLTTAMLFVLGFLASLVIGGLNGVVTAIVPFDWQVHDTYFVVSHLHYVLVGTNMLPVFAALYYWFPKMVGRRLDERLGRWSFWLSFVGLNVTFFPMQLTGLLGMPRRIFTYSASQGWEGLNLLSTIGAGILTVGIAITLWNILVSIRGGVRAGENPWSSDTLEWSIESPPPPYGSVHLPLVQSRHPLWDEYDEEHDPRNERILDEGRFTFTTSAVEARPYALAKMAPDTMTPLLLALGMLAIVCALLFKLLWVSLAAVLATGAVAAVWFWPARDQRPSEPPSEERNPLVTALDDQRGRLGMLWFIATEATLFVLLFFSYYYLGPWPTEPAPKLGYALTMLAVLLLSSAVLHWGELRLKAGRHRAARIALGLTVALGVGFVVLQVVEYADHLKTLTPQMGSYGSIFYTLTTFHAAHLLFGLGMLAYVLFLPRWEPTEVTPHRPFTTASLYWHFVDFVWVFIVGLLYVLPHFQK